MYTFSMFSKITFTFEHYKFRLAVLMFISEQIMYNSEHFKPAEILQQRCIL